MTRPYKRGPLCSHCDRLRAKKRAYCDLCWAEYQRKWRALRAREFNKLRRIIKNVSRETMDDFGPRKAGNGA